MQEHSRGNEMTHNIKEKCSCGEEHIHEEIHTDSHEGATVCSLKKEFYGSPKEANEFTEKVMKELVEWCKIKEFLIGHIKAFIHGGGIKVNYSTVGDAINVDVRKNELIVIGFTAIIFGVAEHDLKHKILELMDNKCNCKS